MDDPLVLAQPTAASTTPRLTPALLKMRTYLKPYDRLENLGLQYMARTSIGLRLWRGSSSVVRYAA